MNRTAAINELKSFTKVSNAAWRKMMNGTEADARTVRGEEGSNYLAWCAAADAECAFREKHDLCDFPNRRRSN